MRYSGCKFTNLHSFFMLPCRLKNGANSRISPMEIKVANAIFSAIRKFDDSHINLMELFLGIFLDNRIKKLYNFFIITFSLVISNRIAAKNSFRKTSRQNHIYNYLNFSFFQKK